MSLPPHSIRQSHPAALTTKKYGINKKELLKACLSREYLLMKRNNFAYIFELAQLTIMAIITMTVFLRTQMSRDDVTDGGIYIGALFFGITVILFNGFAELNMTIAALPVFYKQRDLLFYPAGAFSLPSWILKIPISIMEVAVWVFVTYYVIGFDPNVKRLFRQYLLLVILNQVASGLFRFLAAAGRDVIVTNTCGSFALLVLMVLGGFVLSREDVKKWWIWGYWISPLMYGQNALAANEFLGKQWRDVPPNSTEPLGVLVLKSRGFFPQAYWYWIGVGALFGYMFLFNGLYTLALGFLKALGKPKAVISEEAINESSNDLSSDGAAQSPTSSSSMRKGSDQEARDDSSIPTSFYHL
ncbi:Abc transporter g family member [Thalictrum thalictroides]|uniref:Abc transporter g family member n=1 Tax=Thalictrum thalictroides TaxID=46969 RepID=A0A7J6WNI7_THATH|nr:Abc transporter g family member [Thalictrum thalictroides]